MSVAVLSWWSLLCTVAAVNVTAWWIAARKLGQRRGLLTAEEYVVRRLQLALSAVYVLGCAYRSVFPVYDVPRLCLFGSWVSSVLLGRSIATCAELAFVAQWALALRQSSKATASQVGKVVSLALVPLIAIAETCSWYSVLTTSNAGHVMEESLWGVAAGLLVVSVAVIVPRCAVARRPALLAWCAAGLAYVNYMFLVDVPMYLSRWALDHAGGRRYLTVAQGFHDAATRWSVSHRWQDWKSEVIWMSLYFSVCVWISISLVHAPTPTSRSLARSASGTIGSSLAA